MTDNRQRTIHYLRVSVTDRCNLRCRYCMPCDVPSVAHEEILRYEEIERICRAGARLGLAHVRITGGEPLVRKGCASLVASLKKIKGIQTVHLTTNGVLLAQQLDDLLAAGLNGVNISLDTLDKTAYQNLTGQPCYPRVWQGITAALAAKLPVRLNCVPLAGVNENQLLPLAKLAQQYPLDVRFIELMPMGAGQGYAPVSPRSIFRQLQNQYPDLAPDSRPAGHGPARYYHSAALQGRIGFIDALSHSFCAGCNRVRLTSTGFLKLCLYHPNGVNLKALLRTGVSDEALCKAMQQAIAQKPQRHHFTQNRPPAKTTGMSAIGG